jgi:hypothetical protein
MVSAMTAAQQGEFYALMRNLIINKSKFVKENYDSTSGKFITPIMFEIAIGECLCDICDYIFRPDTYVFMNPTLQYILADYVIGDLTIRYKLEANSDGGASTSVIDPSNIKQFKQGDTTIIMQDASSDTSSYPTHRYGFFTDRIKPQLNRWRRPIH